MQHNQRFLQQLALSTPIMQAAMAGASDASFVAAACQAGALGSLGAGMMSPSVIAAQIAQIRKQTDKAFAVNLMILDEQITERFSETMPAWLQAVYAKMGVQCVLDDRPAPSFQAQFSVLLTHPVPVASFTFGMLSAEQISALHERGTQVIGTATHPQEALAWAKSGADAIILQGAQAGGHRGGWLYEDSEPLLLQTLFTKAQAALHDANLAVPLIAAGGIATRQSVVHYLNQGAAMVSVGTAFLTTHESPIADVYRQRLLGATGDQTCLTRLYSGKLARGIVTDFMRKHAAIDGIVRHAQIPAYPMTNAMTKSLRAYAAQVGDSEMMSLWAGEGVGECQAISIAQLIERLKP